MTELAVLVSWQILKGSQDFLYPFSMALYHKWDVKNGFNYVLQFFSLISDGVGGVPRGYLQTYSHFEIMAIQVGIVQPPSNFNVYGTGSELCTQILSQDKSHFLSYKSSTFKKISFSYLYLRW